MKYFFIGFLLIFLDLSITFNTAHIVNIMPDFIGYYFILKGLHELTPYSAIFNKACPVAKALMVYNIFLWILAVIAIPVSDFFLLDLFSEVGALYLFYQIIRGIAALEQQHGLDLRGRPLMVLWKVALFFTVGILLLGFFFSVHLFDEILPQTSGLALLLALCGFTVNFVLLVRFYQAWRAWDKAQLSPAEPTPTVPLEKTELTAPDAASTEPQS